MQVSRWAAIAMLAATALGGSAVSTMTALANKGHGGGEHHGAQHGQALLMTTMAPSVPGDPVLHGVAPGGAPWVLARSEARLRRDGRIDVRLRGLVIPTPPANGTAGPVTMVSASLYCGADTTAVGTTPSVPISSGGDAQIHGRITVPSKCLGPVVLVHPNDSLATYIAASGFGG